MSTTGRRSPQAGSAGLLWKTDGLLGVNARNQHTELSKRKSEGELGRTRSPLRADEG